MNAARTPVVEFASALMAAGLVARAKTTKTTKTT
jgi:hypothetical protein